MIPVPCGRARIRFPSERFPAVVGAVNPPDATATTDRAGLSRGGWRVGAAIIVLAGVLAYGRTFSAPFIFDDHASIVDNPSIRHLWPLTGPLTPPHADGVTVGGRPVVNLTLAVNYALSGEAVWSYHALNLLIHLGGGLVLFGLVRRTLASPMLAKRFGADAGVLALAVAALWTLHPLQTESVTYVAQRAESLAGCFFLLTLYAFARGTRRDVLRENQTAPPSGSGRGWLVLSATVCAIGMATKEVMAPAPLLVLLYDRTFVAGSLRGAWRQRRGFYLTLAVTWLPLGWLALGTAGRGGTAGFDTPVSVWHYLLTQCGAITRYLRLVFLPHPLVFDYGVDVVTSVSAAVLPGLLLLALLGATAVALVRRPAWGFLGTFFFAILAPSSSFVPVASQPVAEHRMYLPLAAVLAGLVLGVHAWRGRRALWLWAASALLCGAMTWQRNETYRSELALWSDTVQRRPGNARAQSNLGNALLAAGQASDAAAHYEEALRLSPDYADAENNLGRALVQLGRAPDAIPHYEAALHAKPGSIEVLTNLGSALVQGGRAREAVPIYERALQLAPQAIGPRYNLANALFRLGDLAAAAAHYSEVVRLAPDHLDARFNLAATLLRLGRIPGATAAYEDLLRRAPNDAAAHAELANILAHTDRVADAIAHYETALRLQPDFPAARAELDRLRALRADAKP